VHGKDDWYPPAAGELHRIWQERLDLGNFVLTGNYHASSVEHGSSAMRSIRFSDGSETSRNKNSTNLIRCARR
jgi:hypothetical protein